jgi:hypothetical protein
MVALSDLHKYSADIATKAKEWRALTSEVCKCRKIGQQMERVQTGIAIFGAGFAPPQLALMDEEYVQNKEKQVITSEMRAFMGFDELFNCMNAVMQY